MLSLTLLFTLSFYASSVLAASKCNQVTIRDDFNTFDHSVWNLELGPADHVKHGKDGLVMRVPNQDGILPTIVLGTKQTFRPPVYFDIEMQASDAPGIVTPAIFRGHGNATDEIDLEFMGGDPRSLQTVIWKLGERVDYSTKSGPWHPTKKFYKYRLNWLEDRVILSVDGKVVRTHKRENVNNWPTQALNVKLGPWASDSGADWAGVVDWKKHPQPEQRVKSIKIKGCAAY